MSNMAYDSRNEWFHKYEFISRGFVYMGDDYAWEITDNGTLKIKIHNRTICTIHDIRYVKGLKMNLFF